MSETVLQEGNVGDLPVIDLILLARGSGAPTIVELVRGRTTRRFYFRDAHLVAFTTTNPKESLPEFLVRRKKLQAAVAASVQTVADADGITPAQVILRDRMLPTPDLATELGNWASLLLVQAFSWSEGTFRVLIEGAATPPPETLMEVSLPQVLAQGVWKKMGLDAVRQYVAPYMDFRAEVSAEPPFDLAEFRLTPDRLRLYELVRTKDTLREAIDAARLPEEEALRLIFLLQRTGMIDMVPATASSEMDAIGDFDLGDFGDDELEPDDFDFDNFDGGPTDPGMPAAPSPPPSKPDIAAWLASSSSGEFRTADAPEQPVSPSPASQAAPSSPAPAPSPPSPPSARGATGGRGDLGVDLSAIGFRGGGAGRSSSTVHVGGGGREELGTSSGRGPSSSRAAEPARPRPSGGRSGLAGLFDDVDFSGASSSPRPVSPPRGGRSVHPPGGRSVSSPRSAPASEPTAPSPGAGPAPRSPSRAVAPPRGMDPVPPPTSSDGPPPGPGPLIEAAEWDRLPTKEKDRIRGLRAMLTEFESSNYFEMFDLSEEASPALIKKSYFKLARRFHPDSLVDENPIYSRMAEAVFAKVSEAYEVLSEDETREKYVAKYIRGEKDENDLAMEKVQQILGAEGAYKAGLRLINQGKAVPAVEKFEEAVRLYDEEPEYRGWLGYALFRANQAADYERALAGEEMLKQAIAENPTAAALPHLMGKIAIMRKDWGNARMWLRKSLKINADNPEALREYKRVDDMIKGGGKSAEDSKSGLKGLFGRFGKK